MPSSSVLLSLLLAVASPAFSSPAAIPKRTFSIQQRSTGDNLEDGAYALRKAYLKHGMPLPAGLVKRQFPPPPSRVEGTTTVEAISEFNDLEYLTPVEIGDTTMQLDFDTGSSDLWVFSDRLPANLRTNHNYYLTLPPNNTGAVSPPVTARRVTGVEKEGWSWKIQYGDGTGASGLVFADKVRVGGATATEQAVEVATAISAQFHQERSDGLLGLGFGRSNTIKPVKQKTWFENVKPQLKEPLFTVALKKNATGTYDFGFIDESKHDGPITYIPVNTTRGYWEYTATGYQIGNSPPVPMNFQSIADTGTTLLLLPPPIPRNYYAQVPGAKYEATEGGFVYPCSSATSLPPLTLFVGPNVKAVLPANVLDRGKSLTGSGKCFGGLQSGMPDLSIWGDVFMKSQFMVFKGTEPPMLGFSQQKVVLPSVSAAPKPRSQ
jgi:hypothetical protein